jgi:hypothetical protein
MWQTISLVMVAAVAAGQAGAAVAGTALQVPARLVWPVKVECSMLSLAEPHMQLAALQLVLLLLLGPATAAGEHYRCVHTAPD